MQALSELLPLDACVLGMGEDLHIASLFPGADRLDEAISAVCGTPAMRLRAPGAQEERMTLTAPVLTGAERRYMLIHGAGKRAALDRARAAPGAADAPVLLVLDRPNPVAVYWPSEAHSQAAARGTELITVHQDDRKRDSARGQPTPRSPQRPPISMPRAGR